MPDHCVCHEFQTVPKILAFSAATWSKSPSTLITRAGSLLTSNHSSPDGSKVHTPVHVNVKTGFKFSTLVAYGCCIPTTSLYGNVIILPVF